MDNVQKFSIGTSLCTHTFNLTFCKTKTREKKPVPILNVNYRHTFKTITLIALTAVTVSIVIQVLFWKIGENRERERTDNIVYVQYMVTVCCQQLTDV